MDGAPCWIEPMNVTLCWIDPLESHIHGLGVRPAKDVVRGTAGVEVVEVLGEGCRAGPRRGVREGRLKGGAGRVGELARAEEVRPITAVSGWVLHSAAAMWFS